MWLAISSGFLVGILAQFHCLGMCGPIAIALPVHNQTTFKKILSIIAYNKGRVFTYSILGLLFGSIGSQLFIGIYQQYISIAIGILILLALFVPQLTNRITQLIFFVKFQNIVQHQLSKLFQKEKNIMVFYFIGILNGLLPCGLVYMAIAGAITQPKLLYSVLFMASFGIATMPIMIFLSYFGNTIVIKYKQHLKRVVPFVIGIMAVLFILRGLNLGIPYLSPKIEHTEQGSQAACCHHE